MEEINMKRKNAVVTGFAAGLLAVAVSATAFAAQATADSAQSTALKDAGVKEENLAFVKTEIDYDDGQQIYEVSFLTNDFIEYDYDIKAADGSIIKIDYDAETKFYNGDNSGKAITLDQAKESALAHAGQKADQVTFTKTRTDYDDGRQIHEVEFVTDAGEKYDYEYDAKTGYLFKWDFEAAKSAQRAEGAQNAGTSLEDAKAAALKKAGLKDSQVTWGNVHADYDDGRLQYEGKFFHNSLEYEFEIDAGTGNVTDWDVESIYD